MDSFTWDLLGVTLDLTKRKQGSQPFLSLFGQALHFPRTGECPQRGRQFDWLGATWAETRRLGDALAAIGGGDGDVLGGSPRVHDHDDWEVVERCFPAIHQEASGAI